MKLLVTVLFQAYRHGGLHERIEHPDGIIVRCSTLDLEQSQNQDLLETRITNTVSVLKEEVKNFFFDSEMTTYEDGMEKENPRWQHMNWSNREKYRERRKKEGLHKCVSVMSVSVTKLED